MFMVWGIIELFKKKRSISSYDVLFRILIISLKILTGSIILRVAYGYELKPDDPYITLVNHAVEGLTATFGAGYLVDIFPILKYVPQWMPGARFKRDANKWRISTRKVVEMPWSILKDKYNQGQAPQCYGKALLDANGGAACDPATEKIIMQTAGTLYAAGADSTCALICSFVLAMVLHPDVQRRAQVEIDEVVGPHRIPTLEDRSKLPFLECIIKEIYRWNPAAPLSVPHKLMRDDVYEGYYIPDGTTVIPNIWAMCHDPDMYPDPMSFNPDRYLDLSPEEAKASDPRNFVFGFGRRICVGQVFGEDVVYLTIAVVLACLNIRRKVVDGREIIPTADYPDFVGCPRRFECDVAVRSQERIALLH